MEVSVWIDVYTIVHVYWMYMDPMDECTNGSMDWCVYYCTRMLDVGLHRWMNAQMEAWIPSWLCFANEDHVEEVHVSCRHARDFKIRPMRDRQVRLQWQQVKVSSGFGVVAALFFLLWRFSSMANLRKDSKEEAALLIVRLHVPRSSARVVHSRWLMLHAPRDFCILLYTCAECRHLWRNEWMDGWINSYMNGRSTVTVTLFYLIPCCEHMIIGNCH